MKTKSFCISIVALLIVAFPCVAQTQQQQSTVSVSGAGSVMIQPDLVQVDIALSNIAKTTKLAKAELDKNVAIVLQIFKDVGIPDASVRTRSLTYAIEREYRAIGGYATIGQRAQQTFIVIVDDIKNAPDRFPTLLDKLAEVNSVTVNNIKFDVKDKEAIYKQSRELAYKKALDKAEQYAALSGQKVVQMLKVEESRDNDVVFARPAPAAGVVSESAPSARASVPTGESEVKTELRAEFLLR
ncbi:MAG: hypothetical protein Ta2A_04890 [Treponemataceae bacterium]|nr:MAG: hypothetical protein Ta2A_04890 [Treponemataceae bacterium]